MQKQKQPNGTNGLSSNKIPNRPSSTLRTKTGLSVLLAYSIEKHGNAGNYNYSASGLTLCIQIDFSADTLFTGLMVTLNINLNRTKTLNSLVYKYFVTVEKACL